MQDKYTNFSAQSSPADLGWERMATLLDAEMPAQEAVAPNRGKKRGLIWLWLLVGFVITAGAAATMYQYKRPAPQQPEKPAKEGFNPAIAQVERTSSPSETAVAVAEPATTMRQTTLALLPAAQKHSVAVATTSMPESDETIALPTYVEAAPKLEPKVAGDIAYSTIQHTRWAGASPMLQAAVPSSLLTALPDLGLEAQLKTKRNTRKKIRFGVELATGIVAGTGNVENFSAGAVAVWKPGALVAARSGLLAGSHTGDLYMPTSARQSLANDPNGLLFDNSNPLQAIESRAFSGQAYRFQAVTLQLPAVLSYYLSPRLSVEGGITAGLLLNLQNVAEASGEFDQLTNTGTSPTANFSQAQLSDAVSNSVARWELLASAGLRCQITPKFSVGLHYQHGLNDLLPDSSLQAMQRNVRLSGAMLF